MQPRETSDAGSITPDHYWRDRLAPLPAPIRAARASAVRLQWWSLLAMSSVVVVMALASGGSPAMKAAWFEDILSMVPAVAYLVASRYRERSPNRRYPFGYSRALSIAFLAAATALLLFGGYILYDGVHQLIKADRSGLGTTRLFGREIWSGWVMIAALAYSVVPPMILARSKLRLAETLQEKTLHTDAVMMRDDWLTGATAAGAVLAVGAGWWWADSAAACFIALQVLKDGREHFLEAVAVLMDRRPGTIDLEEEEPLLDRVRARTLAHPGVENCHIRLREQGDLMVGEIHVQADGPLDVGAVRRDLLDLDWRLRDLVVLRRDAAAQVGHTETGTHATGRWP